MSTRKYKRGDIVRRELQPMGHYKTIDTLVIEILEVVEAVRGASSHKDTYKYVVLINTRVSGRIGVIDQMNYTTAQKTDDEAYPCDRDGNALQTVGHSSEAALAKVRYDGSPVPWTNAEVPSRPCTCPMTTIMNTGCTCGHIQRGQWGIR